MEIMTPDRTAYFLNQQGIKALFETAFEFIEDFSEYDSSENGKVILAALKASGKSTMSLSEFQRLFGALVATRRVITNAEREAEEQAEQEVLADEQRQQEQAEADRRAAEPSEFEVFYSQHTASAIRERIRTDRAFAEFARNRIAGESQKADGVAGPQQSPEPHAALRKFASNYRSASAASLKPVNGQVRLGNETFTHNKFQQLVEQASAAGLI